MTVESWVKREAEKRKEQERALQQKSAARLDRAKKVADKAPALWEKFAAVVENHVAEFNQLFHDKQKLFEVEKPASGTLAIPADCLNPRFVLHSRQRGFPQEKLRVEGARGLGPAGR